jgi:23S rRNA (guanosine2251-2'-O)-methyltransferase
MEQLHVDAGRFRRLFVHGQRGGAAEAIAEARRAGIPIQVTDARMLDRLAEGARHQGIVAEVDPYEYAEWEDLLDRNPDCLVALDEVTDPRNFGAIVRTAEASGAGGVLVPRHRSAGVTAVVARASAGATARVPVARVTNLVRALEASKEAGFWVIGLDGDAEETIFSVDLPERIVLVLGAEGRGLRPIVRRACDRLVSIPMRGAVGSLNVSVAAGIALYERMRKRFRPID